MKKLLSAFLLFALLISLISCGAKYEPVASTKDESRVVMTANVEGKKYEIKYELYRALFLACKPMIDGGDESVWSGDNKDEYISRANALIKARAAEIYSVFHVAKKIGINVYSDEFDGYVEKIVELSVDGGYYDDTQVEGFGGDYQKYLEYLKGEGLNYSVQDLMIRYSLASAKIFEYYVGNIDSEEHLDNLVQGKLEYTEDDVKSFYESSECVRVLKANLSSLNFSRERAEEIKNTLIEKAKLGEEAVAFYIIGLSVTGGSDIKAGEIIAKHNLDSAYYSELTEAAFSLETFGVSKVIEINATDGLHYNILYKAVKDSTHYEENYNMIRSAYLQNEVGKIIDTAADLIKNSIENTELMEEIIHSEIKMN